MRALERRIRVLLRAYPPGWRDARGDELVTTVLDLAREGQRWPSFRVAADLLVGGWRQRTKSHIDAAGLIGAGWRLAIVLAAVLQLAVTSVWLGDWLSGEYVLMLPVIGAASELTYVSALAGFAIAFVLWLAGGGTAARWVAIGALTAWTLTVFVFQMLLAGGTPSHVTLLAWTYLAVLATCALWQPPPTHRRSLATLVVVLVVLTPLVNRAMTTGEGYLTGSAPLTGGALQVGVDALPSVVLSSWVLVALASLLVVRLDPRPAVAVIALSPVAAAFDLDMAIGTGALTGGLVAALLLVVTITTTRAPDSRR